MKTVVMRTGAGIAIPLPGRLAEQLLLSPGSKVRIEGPDAEGAIRIVRIRSGDTGGESSSRSEPPTGEEVARALSERRAPSAEETRPGLTQELEGLLERHRESFRELAP